MRASWRPVARAAAERIFAIKLRRPRERTEAEHHYVAPRMRERKLELNSESAVRHRVEALHENGIVRGNVTLCVKKNKRALKKKQRLVLCMSKHSKGKDRNARRSSCAPDVGDRAQSAR